jgi:protein phosphatase 1K
MSSVYCRFFPSICRCSKTLSLKCSKNINNPLIIQRYGSSSALSDPENKGRRQKGVNFETLGSWNNRMDMPIMIEESIKTGKLIPEIPLDQVGKATLLGHRKVNEDRYNISLIDRCLMPTLAYNIS